MRRRKRECKRFLFTLDRKWPVLLNRKMDDCDSNSVEKDSEKNEDSPAVVKHEEVSLEGRTICSNYSVTKKLEICCCILMKQDQTR